MQMTRSSAISETVRITKLIIGNSCVSAYCGDTQNLPITNR